MCRRLVAALAVMLSALTLVFAGATGASAADGISVSRDGRTWASTLPSPLFDDSVRWVPGDTRVAQFFVRNDSGMPSEMQVDFVSTRIDELVRIGDLEVSARVDGGPWGSVDAAQTEELADATVAAGGVRPVEVRVTLPSDSPNLTQILDLAFEVRVTLSQQAGGLIPTGGDIRLALLVVAATVAATGAILLGLARRRDRRTREAPHG
ncbi:hypothetical protein [Microbacterium istanbulense]|uniref:LPXTG-motif cell wall anchor domain-containing protein n=1 Tax=Microbacterium istanbulense TaxID=3122049 RepID=A0ABU8LGA8_9MICO